MDTVNIKNLGITKQRLKCLGKSLEMLEAGEISQIDLSKVVYQLRTLDNLICVPFLSMDSKLSKKTIKRIEREKFR